MLRIALMIPIATMAATAATPASADPGGAPHGGPNAGSAMGGLNAGGGLGINAGAGSGPMSGGLGASVRGDARINSQGAINANSRAMERANINSAIKPNANDEIVTGTRIREHGSNGASVRSMGDVRANGNLSARTNLTGVVNGTTVVNADGDTVGTVTGVRTVGNGNVKAVQITLTDGSVINVDSRSLAQASGTLTTNTTTGNVKLPNASLNGQIHASPKSAVGGLAGISTLTGLATGLTVNNSGGEAIGTVSGIVTSRSGAVLAINVDLDAGGTVSLPATTLSMDGTTVVTNSTSF